MSPPTFDVVVVGGIYREVLDGDTDTPKSRLLGSGLTAAIASSRFGASTSLVSFVGADDYDTARLVLQASGVDATFICSRGGRSGTFVFPHEDAQRGSPWPMYRPAEDIPDKLPILPRASLYLVFGFPDFDPIGTGSLDGLPEEATLVWDRQGWLSRTRDCRPLQRLKVLRKIYVANCAETEEEFQLSGEGLLETLPPLGFQSAMIKHGARGTQLIEVADGGRQATFHSAFIVETSNTIGSGDVFGGVVAASLAQGMAMDDCVRRANAAASCYLRYNCDPLAVEIPGCARELTGD